MNAIELEKAKVHTTVETIDYVPNSVVIKTILKKSSGSVSVMSFDKGEGLPERITPFDTFLQVIEGEADIVINGNSNLIRTGQLIVIPAHAPNFVRANGRFKMIMTVIKSGYE